MTRRRPPTPRARPHPFRLDRTVRADHSGRFTCRCGSLDSASVHRPIDRPPRTDVARLAAGDTDDDEEPDA